MGSAGLGEGANDEEDATVDDASEERARVLVGEVVGEVVGTFVVEVDDIFVLWSSEICGLGDEAVLVAVVAGEVSCACVVVPGEETVEMSIFGQSNPTAVPLKNIPIKVFGNAFVP